MVRLLALDVAILPPPDVAAQAIALSAALPAAQSQGLRLGGDRLPHITLTQQFVAADDADAALAAVDGVLRGRTPLTLRIAGGGKGSSSVWMSVERSPELDALHVQLMAALEPFERSSGTAAAFVDGNARPGDVKWVSGFRRSASFGAFTPHITLGHAPRPPKIAPFDFSATTIAACQLGRFCTCRRVIRRWDLLPAA